MKRNTASPAVGLGDVDELAFADASPALGDQVRPGPTLQALVGRRRAAILVRLDRPARAGKIAEALCMLPGGTTYHLRNLEAAGLVTRTRRGPYVIVERTTRGTALLGLYDMPSAEDRS